MKTSFGFAVLAGLVVPASAGCVLGSRVEVRTTTTTTTALSVTTDGQAPIENSVRTEGKDTILAFRGKTVIVRNLVGYTAVITPSSMKVQVGPVAVALDERELSVSGPDYHTALTVWKDLEGGGRLDLLEGRKIIIWDVPPYFALERE